MAVLGIGGALVAAKAFARPVTSAALITGNIGDVVTGPSNVGLPADIKTLTRGYIAAADLFDFGGFFENNGIINHSDIMALFQIESAFKPDAINLNDGGAGNHAYGLGQMLATTAADMGVNNPADLFDAETSVFITLKYLRWIYDYLAPRMGRNPTRSEWIGAYNMGIGNILNGKLPLSYLAKHAAAKLIL